MRIQRAGRNTTIILQRYASLEIENGKTVTPKETLSFIAVNFWFNS
jgi:hypothetical protein